MEHKQNKKNSESLKINKDFFGWYSDKSDTPEHDPGMSGNCVICSKKLDPANVSTISFLVPNDNRSYFYRTHKTCYDSMSEADISEIEGSVIDQIIPT